MTPQTRQVEDDASGLLGRTSQQDDLLGTTTNHQSPRVSWEIEAKQLAGLGIEKSSCRRNDRCGCVVLFKLK